MDKKKFNILYASVLVILLIVVGIKVYYDYQNNFYEEAPGYYKEILIAQSDKVAPVSYKNDEKQDRFYIHVDKKEIDNGILYEPKEKNEDKGFLITPNHNGSYTFIY